jgi:flavin-dependent dehydrogenase
VAWQASIPAPADLDDDVQMHLFEEGYFGFCRYNDSQAVVSMVLDARRTKDPLRLVRRYFPDLPEQEWLRMNPITRAPAQVGKGRVWLVGDSARVVEPFTGEGIYFALATALLAAESASAGLAANDLDRAFRTYAGRHRRLYLRRAWVNTLVRWALETPSRTVHLIETFQPGPGLFTFLSDRIHAT